MFMDTHYGLPSSVADVLRGGEPSHAAQAAPRKGGESQAPAGEGRRSRLPRLARVAFAGFALSAGLSLEAYAATPLPSPSLASSPAAASSLAPSSLEGRWVMAPRGSHFVEKITGPAPDQAVLTVQRDDHDAFAYELVESRKGTEVARGAYDISFGGASTSTVDGAVMQVAASRQADGGVVIEAPPVGEARALIRMHPTGPNTAVLDHEVSTPSGSTVLESIALVRTDQTASN